MKILCHALPGILLRFAAVLVLTAILTIAGQAHAATQSAADSDRASPYLQPGDPVLIRSGIEVKAGHRYGRGFIIAKNSQNWAVTAAHVVVGQWRVKVNGQQRQVTARHADQDIAFIYLGPSHRDGIQIQQLGRVTTRTNYSNRGNAGQRERLRGCPLRSGPFVEAYGERAYPGQSGSPALNPADGQLLGTVICASPNGRTIIVPWESYQRLIPDQPPRPQRNPD